MPHWLYACTNRRISALNPILCRTVILHEVFKLRSIVVLPLYTSSRAQEFLEIHSLLFGCGRTRITNAIGHTCTIGAFLTLIIFHALTAMLRTTYASIVLRAVPVITARAFQHALPSFGPWFQQPEIVGVGASETRYL